MSQTEPPTKKQRRWLDPNLDAEVRVTHADMVRASGGRLDVEIHDVYPYLVRIGIQTVRGCLGCRAGSCQAHGAPDARRRGKSRSPAGPEAPAYERYARAYAEGHERASGRPYDTPIDSQGQYWLRRLAQSKHAAGLAKDDLLTWFRKLGEDFRRATPDDTYAPGWHPKHAFSWLNAGRKSGASTTRQAAPKRGYAAVESVK